MPAFSKPALPTCVASAIYQATAAQHDAMVIAWRYLSVKFSKPRYIAAPGSADDYAIRAMRAAHDEFTGAVVKVQRGSVVEGLGNS